MAEFTLGDKLRGFGAVLQGKFPEFQQQMAGQESARQQAMYQDAYAAQQLLSQGDYDGVISLGLDRINILNRLGIDSTDTQGMVTIAQAARGGNQQAATELSGMLGSLVNRGIAMGAIARPAAPEYLGIEQGQILTRNPITGEVTAETLAQDGVYIDPEEKNEALKGIRSGMTAWNKSASEVSAAYEKVQGLESEMRNKNRAAINAGIMNVARLISPGVVTDRDAAALSGADTVPAAIYSFLSGKGVDMDQLMRIMDPANPDTFNVDQLMAVARNVTSAQIPSLMNAVEDMRNVATNYRASNQFMDSYFGDTATMNSLSKIMEQVSGGATAQPQQTAPQMPPPGTPVYATFEDAERAAGQMAVGDVVYYWENGELVTQELE